jgi:hypothetical protein
VAAVYSLVDGNARWSNGEEVLELGEEWDDSAALVKERPELFTSTPPVG